MTMSNDGASVPSVAEAGSTASVSYTHLSEDGFSKSIMSNASPNDNNKTVQQKLGDVEAAVKENNRLIREQMRQSQVHAAMQHGLKHNSFPYWDGSKKNSVDLFEEILWHFSNKKCFHLPTEGRLKYSGPHTTKTERREFRDKIIQVLDGLLGGHGKIHLAKEQDGRYGVYYT